MRRAPLPRRPAAIVAMLALIAAAAQPQALALAGTTPAPMGAMAGPMADAARTPNRAGLDLLREVLAAGGGAANFTTVAFVGSLTGQPPEIEFARLTGRFGAADVKTFVTAFDAVIGDATRSLRARTAEPAGTSAGESERDPALARALYAAGIDRRTHAFNVETLLDRLLSPRLHLQSMVRVSRAYGPAADATYHLVLARLVEDAANEPR